jgi:hypothetical protein
VSASKSDRDWVAWHGPYDVEGSPLHARLQLVQARIREALDAAKPGSIGVISACAGQGRDLLPVLAVHPRGADVRARLVELDAGNAEAARAAVAADAITGVDVITGDASNTSAYAGAVPADLVLFCGIWGNVPDVDVARSIEVLPMLCAPGATVLWTRSRHEPDLTVAIRRWLPAQGFEELSFDAPSDVWVTVGAHRFVGPPADYKPGVRMFTFV